MATTLLRTSPEHDFSVLELGTDAPGKLRLMIDLIRPRIGVVTTVGLEHLENFDSVAELEAEKATLVQALPANGVAVLNADDPAVLAMGAACAGRVVTVGLAHDATLRAEDVEASWPERLSFTVRHGGSTMRVQTGLCGRHWVQPVLLSLAVGLEAGVPLPEAARAVESVESFRGRMQPVECADGVTFIRDDAKHDVLTTLRALDFIEEARAARKIVVIGRIGDFEGDPHEVYAALAKRALAVADEVIFTGHESVYAPEPKNGRLRVLTTVKETSQHLRETTRPGDVVLLRASRRSHLDRIVLAHAGEVGCWLSACGRRRFCAGCELLDFPSEPDARLPARLRPGHSGVSRCNKESRPGSDSFLRASRRGTSAQPPFVVTSMDDASYWLRNCQGFRVESGGKRIGVVDDVLFGQQSEPATLLVRTGLFRLGLRAISVDEIETIDPRRQRLTLRSK